MAQGELLIAHNFLYYFNIDYRQHIRPADARAAQKHQHDVIELAVGLIQS